MHFWQWRETGLACLDHETLVLKAPTLIICNGCFNTDTPGEILHGGNAEVERFLEFIPAYQTLSAERFRQRVCEPAKPKLKLGCFLSRKLLGLVSGVPGTPFYPVNITDGFSDRVDIIEITYTSVNDCFTQMARMGHSIDFFSDDALRFVSVVFAPLIRQYPATCIDTLCRRLRQITLFGISYGSNFIIQIENALRALLLHLDFSAESQKAILRSIQAVAISNITDIAAATGPRFSAVYFEGSNDVVSAYFNPRKGLTGDTAPLDIRLLGPHRALISAPVPATASRWLEVIPEFDYALLNSDKACHFAPYFTMRCEPESPHPELLERVLRNAVTRYQRRDPEFLSLFAEAAPLNPCLSPCAGHSSRENERIAIEINRISRLSGSAA